MSLILDPREERQSQKRNGKKRKRIQEWKDFIFGKYVYMLCYKDIWYEVFKNGPNKIFGRQHLKKLKWCGLFKQTISPQIFIGCLLQILLRSFLVLWFICNLTLLKERLATSHALIHTSIKAWTLFYCLFFFYQVRLIKKEAYSKLCQLSKMGGGLFVKLVKGF